MSAETRKWELSSQQQRNDRNNTCIIRYICFKHSWINITRAILLIGCRRPSIHVSAFAVVTRGVGRRADPTRPSSCDSEYRTRTTDDGGIWKQAQQVGGGGGLTHRRYKETNDQHDIEYRQHSLESMVSLNRRWMGLESVFSTSNQTSQPVDGTALKQQQQQVVDDYLEFLDRRYNRLHDTSSRKKSQFPVWKWVIQGLPTQSDQHHNALYALGVADLASKKLLHKHQLGDLGSSSSSSSVLDSNPSNSTQKSLRDEAIETVVVVAPRPPIFLARLLLRSALSPSLQRLLSTHIHVPDKHIMYRNHRRLNFQKQWSSCWAKVPRATGALLKLSGGMRNITFTRCVMMAIMLFLARFLAHATVNIGMGHRT